MQQVRAYILTMPPAAKVPDGTVEASMPVRNKQPSVERVTDKLETPSLDDRSYRVIRLSNQLEVLLMRAQSQSLQRSVDGFTHIELAGIQFELAGLDSREIQNVVDDG